MIKIYGNGVICDGGQAVRAKIVQHANGKFLTTRILPQVGDISVDRDIHTDIGLAFGHPDLDAVVNAILRGCELPSGWALGYRRDGLPIVKRTRAPNKRPEPEGPGGFDGTSPY